jgi:nucleoside-diphosphate-sugar epimerase
MASEAGPGPEVLVVTGAASTLGRRVCERAVADPSVERVVAIDRRPVGTGLAGVEGHRCDLRTADLKPLFEGASTVVHLAQSPGPRAADAHEEGDDSLLARRVLDAASAVGVRHVVLLSSATAYGAWANNPVPLTEDAPLRPNPGVAMASAKADAERSVGEWRAAHPGGTAAILRPTVTVSAQGRGWLARALTRATSIPITDEEPPAQFLDVDDLASAVDLARRARLDGPRNVAPDGWIAADTARALAGGVPRLRLPERLAVRVARTRWRWGLAATPPAMLPFTVHPWVVANDRLRADGWEPAATNEEAFVASHRAGPWATLSPRRRQELALGAAAAVVVGAVGAVVLMARRRR